ncbi:flagellar assembly protein FliH [Duganella sp. Root198D2]|uniref:flagellar assembly protein FliH n=1 Tax=Duganella sp. Root198D2 TaxID=1736489 RepID=UPI00070D2F78|nr:flagellar assembly protein FliH [Duganella sp. Root198D2]KRC03375.1 flagellar assembly protein FliH [Duganella sp. Root198D2]
MANIPKEQQTAYQRWELQSFGDTRPSALAQREREEEEARAIAAEEAAAQAEVAQAEYAAEQPRAPDYPSEEELAAIREEARQQGYEAGFKAGHDDGAAQALDEARAATEQAIAPVRDIAGNFSAALRDADQAISNEVLELALHLAKGMIKTALRVKPELILPIVREAIEYLPVLQQPALLILNPEDAAVVREGIAEELDKGGWRVIDDPTIERGGCKVDTASNQIDATVQSRWQRLSLALGKDLDWID